VAGADEALEVGQFHSGSGFGVRVWCFVVRELRVRP
jgi:hypothetical protein